MKRIEQEFKDFVSMKIPYREDRIPAYANSISDDRRWKIFNLTRGINK